MRLDGLLTRTGSGAGKSLAVEWSGFAHVNSVSPGYIATDMLDYERPEMVKQWTERVPFG